MDKYNATDHVSPTVTSTRSLHEWLSSLAAQGMTATEIADEVRDDLENACDSIDIRSNALADAGVPRGDELSILRALATAGLCCVDWTAIAAVFVERQAEIERGYLASADESIDTEEVMAAACSVFGYNGEVQGVYFEHGQWWAWVWPEWPDRSGETQAWSMVDASPGNTSVTRPDGRVCRVSFELV